MILRVTTQPAVEPLTVSEVKTHLKIDVSAEDTLLAGYLTAARMQCELEARRAFVTQTLQLKLEAWPWGEEICLPRPPLQSVTSVVYVDSDGNSHTVSAADYIVDTASEPGRLILAYGLGWPGATLQPGPAITITYVAGYGAAADVPATYKQAILLAVGHFYENREQIIVQAGVTVAQLPWGVSALLMTDRGNF